MYEVNWDDAYAVIQPSAARTDDELRIFIENNFASVSNGDCIEIGCYPGTYLSVFGERGYRLHGIDTSRYLLRMPEHFLVSGYRCGEFFQQDLFTFVGTRKYDVVCSFGFVGHFIDYLNAIDKMSELVDREGYIIVTVPNFRGWFQNLFHRFFDRKNFLQHNVAAMNTSEWETLLLSKGFDIVGFGEKIV